MKWIIVISLVLVFIWMVRLRYLAVRETIEKGEINEWFKSR